MMFSFAACNQTSSSSDAGLAVDEATSASRIESKFDTPKTENDETTSNETENSEVMNDETPIIVANNGMEAISKLFDLSDPTDYWSGTIEDLASGGPFGRPAASYGVKVTFKKAFEYPMILNVEDLNFENARSIGFDFSSPPPMDIDYSCYWRDKSPEDFRLTATIFLKERSFEKVLEAIEYLQSLDFIRRAEPIFNYLSGE